MESEGEEAQPLWRLHTHLSRFEIDLSEISLVLSSFKARPPPGYLADFLTPNEPALRRSSSGEALLAHRGSGAKDKR